MICWIRYDETEGEIIVFCCVRMKSIYSKLITFDPETKKCCVKVPRFQKHDYGYGKEIIEEMVKPVQFDLVPIEYCMFCGQSVTADGRDNT